MAYVRQVVLAQAAAFIIVQVIGLDGQPMQYTTIPEYTWRYRGIIAMLALCLTSCSGDAARKTTSAADGDAAARSRDGMVVVFYRDLTFKPGYTEIRNEERIISCVGNAIREKRPQQSLVEFDTFQRIAFPKLSRESVPRTLEFLSIPLKQKSFRDRLRRNGIRYLTLVGGVVEKKDPVNKGGCIGGPYAAVCLIYSRFDRDSRFGATVIDLERADRAQKLETTSWESFYVGLFLNVPFFLPLGPAEEACQLAGHQIAEKLDVSSINEPGR